MSYTPPKEVIVEYLKRVMSELLEAKADQRGFYSNSNRDDVYRELLDFLENDSNAWAPKAYSEDTYIGFTLDADDVKEYFPNISISDDIADNVAYFVARKRDWDEDISGAIAFELESEYGLDVESQDAVVYGDLDKLQCDEAYGALENVEEYPSGSSNSGEYSSGDEAR